MEGRVAQTLSDQGLGAEGTGLVLATLRLAMAPRLERLADVHHPDFLHPGRCVLVLLLDTPLRDPVALGAAAAVESEHEELRVAVRELAPLGAVAPFVASVPIDDEGLAEALVTAPWEVRLVALAERLDQCRHAKFWPEPERRARILDQAERVFHPVAERTDATLARRFRHWAGAFARSNGRR